MKKLFLALVVIIALFASTAHAAICVEAGVVTVTWTANTETDLSHYEVHKSDEVDGVYTKFPDEYLTASATFPDLPEGDYYFKIKAVDTCGNKSGLNEASERARVDRTAPAEVEGRATVSAVAK